MQRGEKTRLKKKETFQQIERRFISLSKRTIKQTRRRVGHEINEHGAQATDSRRKTSSQPTWTVRGGATRGMLKPP